MIQHNALPKQPRRFVSYWNVGKLLYGALVLFIIETFFYYQAFSAALHEDKLPWKLFWSSCLLFSFSHIFLVVMDSWSRFQDYKRIKDYLYLHGFDPRILSPYRGSKCQRMSLITAARELGMEKEVQRYFHKLGIRWFHFIPVFMINDPFFITKKYFWSRTFMEKHYKPKIDYRQLNTISV
ncbi:hypothetical protein [Flavimarina sp. Hel_I_48]|uniref:hypothetical protein n=1 Tax=Flavimarina sp. Hel_I_48 TaxID=1392488 RepID=UPI0004DF2DC9|nr:hypothetical protein [Flavimarina sp. Hel_I_48]